MSAKTWEKPTMNIQIFVGGKSQILFNSPAVPAVGEQISLSGKALIVERREWVVDYPSDWTQTAFRVALDCTKKK